MLFNPFVTRSGSTSNPVLSRGPEGDSEVVSIILLIVSASPPVIMTKVSLPAISA